MNRKLFVLLFTLIIGATSFAQEDQRWYVGKPIESFEFVGLSTVKYSEVMEVIGSYRDQPYSDLLFTEIQLKLYSMEVFKGQIIAEPFKIDENATRVGIRFTVQEREKIQDIVFNGLGGLNEGDLLSVIQIKERDIINQSQIRLDEQAIRDLYLDEGFIQAQVSSKVEAVDENFVNVVFTISEGKRTTVKAILFEGNNYADDNTLKSLMGTKEVGLFQNGIFNEVTLIQDRQAILAWYRDRGYVDAKIARVNREIEEDPETGQNSLTISLIIEEGGEFTYGGIEFVGNKIFSTEELQERVRHEVGVVFQKARFDRDKQAIYDLYFGNGFIFNDIRFEEIREENVLKYRVTIVEKSRAHIENIIIKGNTKTAEEVILRELPFEVGDVYSSSKIREGILNLYNTQYFDLVEPQSPPGSAEGLMDLVINVEEAQTTNILLALAFSGVDQFPITGQVSWQDNNFRGLGQSLSLQASLSPVTQSLDLSFTDNWFLGERFRIGGSLSLAHNTTAKFPQDILFPIYDVTSDGVPDPYDAGVYVFTEDTTFDSVDYKAGDIFPEYITDPDDPRIDNNNLQREYDYDLNNGNLRLSDSYMNYNSVSLALTGRLGYSWYFPFGRVSVGTSGGPSVSYVTYDSDSFRPFEETLRNNLDSWEWVNRLGVSASFDNRDVFFYPNYGIYLSQGLTQAGGFLQGIKNYLRYDAKFEAYYKLWDVKFFGDNIFRGVLAFKTGFSQLFNAIGGPDDLKLLDSDKLFISGMLQGRGWGYNTNGVASWYQNLELRIPFPINELNPQPFFSLDTFIDGFVLLQDNATQTFGEYASMLQNYRFSWGTGIRITNPQIPLGFYLAKPFTFDSNGNLQWEPGDGYLGDEIDMKFVFAITVDF
jgi:outer membrane protein insertion porin family